MKNFINFIIKALISVILFLLAILIILLACTIIFSQNNNLSVTETVEEFQTIGKEFIEYTLADKNSVNITLSDINSYQTTETKPSTKVKYYYNQLDETGKIIYSKLENNIDNFKKENYTLDFSTKFNDLLHKSTGQNILNKSFQSALDAFSYDYPELFYIDITKMTLLIKSTSIGPLTTYTVSISPTDNGNYLNNHFSSKTEVDNAISKVENIRNNAIKGIATLNNYDKILSIHDSLANSLEYDSTLSNDNIHNIYGALIQKKVVCEGYAKAFKYILDGLNIENILVGGTGTNSSGETESHMWNYVKLNGNWYGVDVTWDDPVIIGGISKNNIRHTYFLKGSSTFIKSHEPSGKISDTGMVFNLPHLSKTNYSR